MELRVDTLSEATWTPYAELIARHNGIFGGCWCMGFHSEGCSNDAALNRDTKLSRVQSGDAHAALVFDGRTCIAFCQFGPTGELPRIKNRKSYEATLGTLPDWRITCFFVDRAFRGKGVATMALRGALTQIAERGGGLVESYPDDKQGRRTSPGFIHNGTLTMFEAAGFTRDRAIGKTRWVVTKQV
ncbi:GNAT family N-acetyltransferase [Kribbella sp. CA-253562]|uniref:GNAT family N-acetyltransferase n=1 Tax=Kribbella sp. CA-253562 TaxID=3239942 RepID=UPI003D92C51D